MKKTLLGSTAILSLVTCIVSIYGCNIDAGVNNPTPVLTESTTNNPSTSPSNNPLSNYSGISATYRPKEPSTISRVFHTQGKFLYIYKRSSFTNGAILLTQLYKDNQPEAWWPTSATITVQSNFWEIAMKLGENGIPNSLETGSSYRLEVWIKNKTSIIEKVEFKL